MPANRILMIVAAMVAVTAIIIALVLVYGHGAQSAPSAGGGPGSSYLSKTEAQSLFGQGTYTSTGDANSTSLGQLVSTNVSTNDTTAFLYGNVTAYWQVMYNMSGAKMAINGSEISPFAVEQVFETPVPRLIYAKMLGSSGSFNVTNSTTDGATYSYSQQGITMNGTTFLVAYKSNEVSLVYVLGKQINAQSLASAVAGDMP